MVFLCFGLAGIPLCTASSRVSCNAIYICVPVSFPVSAKSSNQFLIGSFPVAAPGVIEHQKRKMDERSRLLSRRVFSDMERERVREERRRREHRSKVEKWEILFNM